MIANSKFGRPGSAGFTLIEVAIVLVIVGLILGGVLKGRELIGGARVRAMVEQMEGIGAAWFAFQERYGAFPGDFSRADRRIRGDLVNGNGNGVIDTDAEAGQVWTHLAAAGLLGGEFDGRAVAASFDCPDRTCPRNPFNRGFMLRFSDQSVGPGGRGLGSGANELWSGNRIPVALLAELDRRIDDGLPDRGRLQLSRNAAGFANSASCMADGEYAIS